MIARKLILFVLSLVVIVVTFTTSPGCANIIPPSGGPKDSIPPVLISVSPADSSTNFTGNRIVFNFDEYIDLQNVQENLLVSPNPNVNPSVDFRLRSMTVRLRDTLEPNTTYTINFGEAVKDFTEGNPLKNFSYTFSTGSYFDSLTLRGNVVLAETGGIDTTLIVMLHTSPGDSAVVTKKPRYIAKLDREGKFIFRNLPYRTFYLYALKDEGGTRRYFNEKQLFAFADSAMEIGQANSPVTLYAYSADKPDKPTTTTTAPTTPGRRTDAPTTPRLRYETSLMGGMQDLMTTFYITFPDSLRKYDSTLITLHRDSAFNPVPGYRFVLDSTGKKLDLVHTFQENTLYHIIMQKQFATGVNGVQLLKTDTLSFTTRKLSDYGSLRLKLRNVDLAKKPVLQLVMNGTVYKSYPLSGPDLNIPLFMPGEYDMRILFDDNGNGVWDPGQFFGVRRQPEIVKPVDRKITVKANWQNEFEIAL